jgi:hypothetical protein
MNKVKKEKKLGLSKVTVRNLNTTLNRDEQKVIKAGTGIVPLGTTNIPIFCKL